MQVLFFSYEKLELRDQKAITDNECLNICSICSLDRNLFEKNSKGFEDHLNKEHSVFGYIFFMYGLKRKDDTEFTGMERYFFGYFLDFLK